MSCSFSSFAINTVRVAGRLLQLVWSRKAIVAPPIMPNRYALRHLAVTNIPKASSDSSKKVYEQYLGDLVATNTLEALAFQYTVNRYNTVHPHLSGSLSPSLIAERLQFRPAESIACLANAMSWYRRGRRNFMRRQVSETQGQGLLQVQSSTAEPNGQKVGKM